MQKFNKKIVFERLFEPHILQRGYDYYQAKLINNIVYDEDTISADCEGSDIYQLNVVIRDNNFIDGKCSCPHSRSGFYCKHIAALLYELSIQDIKPSDSEKHVLKQDDFKTILDNLKKGELVEFLIYILNKNEDIKFLFNQRFSTNQPKDYFTRIDKITRSCMDKGFIVYSNTSKFENQMCDFIDEISDNIKNDFDAYNVFKVVAFLFEDLYKIPIDDSNGTTTIIADTCMATIGELIKFSDELKREVFTWTMKHIVDNDLDYLDQYMISIIDYNFHEKEYAPIIKSTFSDLIDKYLNEENSYYKYKARSLILILPSIFDIIEASEEEKSGFYTKYSYLPEVTDMLIEEAIKDKNYLEAINLAKRGILINQDYQGIVHGYYLKLIEIYELMNDVENIIENLKVTIYTFNNYDCYLKLKNYFNVNEFTDVLSEVLSKCKKDTSFLNRIYHRENMKTELINSLKLSRSFSEIESYEDYIKDEYEPEIIKIYEEYILQKAEYTSNRLTYNFIANRIISLSKYKDAEPTIIRILKTFIDKYRNRPAMMEEMSALFNRYLS